MKKLATISNFNNQVEVKFHGKMERAVIVPHGQSFALYQNESGQVGLEVVDVKTMNELKTEVVNQLMGMSLSECEAVLKTINNMMGE